MTSKFRDILSDGGSHLSLPANRASFVRLKDWLNGLIENLKVPDKIQKKLLVAVDEIFTNIVSYAYPHDYGVVDVFVLFDAENRCLSITFSDSGIPFNPLAVPLPDLSKPLAERSVGGLGIHLVRNFADFLEYRYENGNNILVFRKILS